MNIVVVGAGVVGVTCAWLLQRDGHAVTLVERGAGPALETSFGSGGQVSVSHAQPWSSPEVPWQLLRWLGRADAPLALRLRADPEQLAWCLRFLRECLPWRHRRNALRNLRLALLSRIELGRIRAETGIDCAHREHGILHVYTAPRELDRARRQADRLEAQGIRQQVLGRGAMLELEPGLVHETDGLVGAIYAPEDQSGDAQRFTTALAGHAAARGVDLRFDCAASGLVRDAGGVRAVACGSTTIECDAVVVAAGVQSAGLLRPLGLRLPIYPVKGYSASLPVENPALAPSLSITHVARRMVVTPLDGILRAAGTVEIGGYDPAVNLRRAAAVMDGMRSLFPEAGDYWQVAYWAGLRPMTPDGPPLLGATPIPNLYLNTGHGSLGWTLAAGSARVLADLLAGRETPLACAAPAPRRDSA